MIEAASLIRLRLSWHGNISAPIGPTPFGLFVSGLPVTSAAICAKQCASADNIVTKAAQEFARSKVIRDGMAVAGKTFQAQRKPCCRFESAYRNLVPRKEKKMLFSFKYYSFAALCFVLLPLATAMAQTFSTYWTTDTKNMVFAWTSSCLTKRRWPIHQMPTNKNWHRFGNA